jgi:hypothetical protein
MIFVKLRRFYAEYDITLKRTSYFGHVLLRVVLIVVLWSKAVSCFFGAVSNKLKSCGLL